MAIAHREFARFGLRPSDMRLEPPWAQFNDVMVQCSIFDLGALIKFRVTETELWTRSVALATGVDGPALIEGVQATLTSFDGERGTLAAHSFSVSAHLTLQETSTSTFIAENVSRAQVDGLAIEPIGVQYELALAENARATIDLARSAIFSPQDTIWMRVTAFFPGSVLARDSRAGFAALLKDVAARFDVIVTDESGQSLL